ncbi:hypothetical protein FBZ94_10241 [Bradyrhizobium sacchari]|uniref:Uncharacterized protein n=2 Tax=Bradyrhizobium sacchari TaxID=1399419 RepID=A0A560KFW1_9BRAD|nr:hypothetical protein FBZ94_10241 [Bradyrhizobium sacchari]TWB80824.1 hypothetical protein FBZ95_10241 [Bradyrhizobium sacchari]
MAGKSDPFNGPLEGWEPLDSPPKGLDSSAPLPKPDRVAQEWTKVARKYAADSAGSGSSSEHATLVRAKKKGSRDSDVNAKTFVLSGNKIVGTQG